MSLSDFSSLDIHSSPRIMGLDAGERRIGVAVSDSLGWTAQGVEVIDRRMSDWLKRLDELVREYDVRSIVVGLPRNMNGTLGPRGEACKQLAKQLEQRYSLPVHLWDERLSTIAAERTLIDADISRKKRKKVIDQMAASWILQGYLDAQRGLES
ncbi:Holliday junction resolvase RuvX [Paenactinomyces guangxiensis]|uniref:Putative pre-16S rRNA nuclease n=1 Tax=Paenactinomyces guangxiensis TaxID=1490290 RepID=A0A7W1WNH4_9BACL|nr:Holliday junction resolvase RuvX [Paenactinomyces guangxiensis]MBA4493018.1 Holliday junction resolvase RuvX [Paenactinomyces guangxiensis]MBH8590133.1 Holliday junction resolvase RuvX [Paenactinomyces guangxiensis]